MEVTNGPKRMRMDTYCGLYCGACEVVNARTDQERRKVITMFETYIPGWRASPEQLHCSGCKSDDVFVNCGKCPVRPCARSKGLEFCHECGDYPCELHKFMRAASNQLPVLRHVRVTEGNLEFIRTHGVEKWIADQEEKWKCPRCGSPFSWYAERCRGCDQDLRGIKDYETASPR